MKPSTASSPKPPALSLNSPFFRYYSPLFIVFIALRCLAWKCTILLEDHDSVRLLSDMRIYRSFDFSLITNVNPDTTPFYPFLSALLSLTGLSLETSARLCSLIFSSLLFWCLVLIGNHIARPLSVLFALLILSFNPLFISLSYSVLTEPSYIAVSYLGLWLFWTRYKQPALWHAALLGSIFALCFLTRTEGFLYLLLLPFLQVVSSYFITRTNPPTKALIGWCCLFVLSFSLLAAPQIWSVSSKLHRFAINGRQVWALLLHNSDGKSYDEKIYGLNYSNDQINLHYAQSHPEIDGTLTSAMGLRYFVHLVLKNFTQLYQQNLGTMIGPLCIVFFAFGLFALFCEQRYSECFVICAFLVSSLAAPFVHNVVVRHIAIIVPLMILVAGIGISYVSSAITERFHNRRYVGIISWACALSVIGSLILPLWNVYRHQPYFNQDYNPRTIQHVVSLISDGPGSEPSPGQPVIAARKAYLSLYANGRELPLPFADYAKLVAYCSSNKVDFLFLEHRMLKNYPFLKAFLEKEPPPEFSLRYREVDDYKERVELYRFTKQLE